MTFLWGAATSAHQIEGHCDQNDWWAWEQEGHIEGGARSGAATDHRARFREDLGLAAGLGLNSYRFSIEWSRIEPEEGRWDESAIGWYRELVAECERRGLLPMATLHHFTSPLWLARKGGFTWEGAPERFAIFTRKIAAELGSRIPLWCTLNEPMVLIAGTYLGSFMPPARFDPPAAAAACRNLLRAHVGAYEALHSGITTREGPWKDHPLLVGIAQNLLDFLPDRAWHPLERVLAGVFRRYYDVAWLDAVTGRKQRFGALGLVPTPAPVPEALGRNTVDFIGVNYYTKAYVQWQPRGSPGERPGKIPIGVRFRHNGDRVSDLEWALHPEGFRRVLRLVARYGLPIYITENGIADHADRLRPEYLVSHLHEIARGIREGLDIRGYYHWSLLDNFEWVKGFGPRFGLYRVDFESQARTATASAQLLKQLIEAHRTRDPARAIPLEELLR